jgi:hypothetical protein
MRIQDPGSGMETVRIRDPGWKKVGSGIRHTAIEFMRFYQSYKVHVLSTGSFVTFNTVDGTPYLCPVSVLQM